MTSFSSWGVFKTVGILLVLAVFAVSMAVFVISQQMATRSIEIRGVAADYGQLAATPVLRERLSYFPQAAKNIEYWCRPHNTGINGSFDIGESDFVEWARAMGWQLRELGPIELPHVQVTHPDGSEELLDRPDKCYVYKHQLFKGSGALRENYELVYDRTRRRAYFEDMNGHSGPPTQGGEGDATPL
jgi:hypothetical protein